jgi:hypothetical protein
MCSGQLHSIDSLVKQVNRSKLSRLPILYGNGSLLYEKLYACCNSYVKNPIVSIAAESFGSSS